MKPVEFWDCTYREQKLFVESNSLQRELEIKQQIILMEQYGNKIISAFNFKKPKNQSLIKDIFKELFQEDINPKTQSVEEQIRNMRNWN